jgi:hypothetical protein
MTNFPVLRFSGFCLRKTSTIPKFPPNNFVSLNSDFVTRNPELGVVLTFVEFLRTSSASHDDEKFMFFGASVRAEYYNV